MVGCTDGAPRESCDRSRQSRRTVKQSAEEGVAGQAASLLQVGSRLGKWAAPFAFSSPLSARKAPIQSSAHFAIFQRVRIDAAM